MTDDHAGAGPFLPPRFVLPALERAAAICTGCDLHHLGGSVFGKGPAPAGLMLVGEQPGDVEEREGHPFVGPAGELLDGALRDVGIDRTGVYLTNAVKHFRWEGMRGKRRLHRKPSLRHVEACRPWLLAEIAAVHPRVVVALGSTAARALLGREVRVTEHRGRLLTAEDLEPRVAITVHPSSVLRARGDEERAAARQAFVADLAAIREALETSEVA